MGGIEDLTVMLNDLAILREQEHEDNGRRLRGAIDFETYIRNRSHRRKTMEHIVDAMIEIKRTGLTDLKG